MATITLPNVDDEMLNALRREAVRVGTTPESLAVERLAASIAQDQEREREREREAWSERLLARLRAGESIDGPLGEELERWRDSSRTWITTESLNAAIREGRD